MARFLTTPSSASASGSSASSASCSISSAPDSGSRSVISRSSPIGSVHAGTPSGVRAKSRSGTGLTSRLISGCTSRIELAMTNGASIDPPTDALAFSGLMISGRYLSPSPVRS